MEQKRKRKRRTVSYAYRDWFLQYKMIAHEQPYHVLLESGQGGRYSIIGFAPNGIIPSFARRKISSILFIMGKKNGMKATRYYC